MIKNPEAAAPAERSGANENTCGGPACDGVSLLRDSAFLRNGTPMTREEVRWVVLGKMGLSANSFVWDVGAGTGSVSIECARQCPAGKVISIEKNPEALKILYQNRAHFGISNMDIIEGTAPEVFEGLERPTHVFIGGCRESPVGNS